MRLYYVLVNKYNVITIQVCTLKMTTTKPFECTKTYNKIYTNLHIFMLTWSWCCSKTTTGPSGTTNQIEKLSYDKIYPLCWWFVGIAVMAVADANRQNTRRVHNSDIIADVCFPLALVFLSSQFIVHWFSNTTEGALVTASDTNQLLIHKSVFSSDTLMYCVFCVLSFWYVCWALRVAISTSNGLDCRYAFSATGAFLFLKWAVLYTHPNAVLCVPFEEWFASHV